MRNPFRKHRSTDEDTALQLHDSSYDAQTDLALPDAEADYHADTWVPYGGMLAPDAHGAGYDAERDTGVNL